jgi:hypothetical protein
MSDENMDGQIMRLLLLATATLWAALRLAGQEKHSQHDEQMTTLHVYTDLVQMPTLILSQDRKGIEPRIDERRFSIRVDSGPWFKVTHVRPEGDDPIALSILLDHRAIGLLSDIDREIADLAPNLLTPRDQVSLYGLGCGLNRSLHDKPANRAMLREGVNALVAPWRSTTWKEESCNQHHVGLWDALGYIAEQMKGVSGRKVILVVSDGNDHGSIRKWNELRAYTQVAGIAVFGITMPPSPTAIVARNDAYPFLALCELTGGTLMVRMPEWMEMTLQRFVIMLRERYILEFPRPSNSTKGAHAVDIKIAGGDRYYVRATAVTARLLDESVIKDPTTVPSDPSRAPEQGKRRVLLR